MKIDLAPNEEILRNIRGKAFELNPITRIFTKIAKLFGRHTIVDLALTNKRLHVYRESRLLWAIVTGRERRVIALECMDMIQALQTTSLLIFKSHNLIFYSSGQPWTGINVKGRSFAELEGELNGFSYVKTLDSGSN